jgi:hypothetical protein
MMLTIGTGPFGKQSRGTFNFDTGVLQPHTLYFEDSPRRVTFNGGIIADSVPSVRSCKNGWAIISL